MIQTMIWFNVDVV